MNPAEPRYTAAMPAAPEWLGEVAKAEWHRVSGPLTAAGVATGVDYAVLVAYCQAWEEFVLATKTLNFEGRYIATNVGHPALVQQRQSMMQIRSYAQELGMTPASRSKVSGNAVADESHDILDSAPSLRIAE